jgi:hypothetical protein
MKKILSFISAFLFGSVAFGQATSSDTSKVSVRKVTPDDMKIISSEMLADSSKLDTTLMKSNSVLHVGPKGKDVEAKKTTINNQKLSNQGTRVKAEGSRRGRGPYRSY